jgi:hypothetical protein
MIRKHFRIRRIVIGLAFAAIVAPSAQAYTGYSIDGGTPSLQSASNSQKAIRSEISVQPTLSLAQVQALRYQAMVDFYARQNPLRSENSFGAPGPSAAGAQGPVATQMVSRASSSSFDWSDAGIGASIVFGAALMLLTAVSLGRRHHRSLASV